MPQNNQYLIISQSGRALAASAKCAGIDTHVIDLFADEDTAEITLSNISVTGFSDGNNFKKLISIVAEYANSYPDLIVVIGSGFEENPELLAELEHHVTVIGNHSSVIRQLKDPGVFFKKLEQLVLPYPQYIIDVTQEDITQEVSGDILIKTMGGAGGSHIRHYQNDSSLTSASFLQAFLRGKNYSATFISDGQSAHVLGFNETWVCKENTDFTFAGAVSNINLSNELRQQVTDAIRRIVVLFKLKGLCGLDFIVEESGKYSILEVNPRPTATFELYETRGSLFTHHLAAFQGKMEAPGSDQCLSRALGLLYAGKSITIPRLDWPEWVTDRPQAGKQITIGEPVCTVHAEGLAVEDVKQQLKTRLANLRESFGFTVEAA
jgi:predicted ATP-grasp superfamily ATP-dependent carboligase